MARDLLKVRLEEIPEDSGLDVHVEPADPRFAELLEDLGELPGERTGSADLHLEIWPERVDVTGSVHATFPAACDRCLETFRQPVDRDFSWYLMRSGVEQPDDVPDEEIELSLRDLDRSELVGDVVDLSTVLREELLLAAPAKTVCRPDCKGICGGCGAELNHEECTCEPEIDPRWEALKQLKLDE